MDFRCYTNIFKLICNDDEGNKACARYKCVLVIKKILISHKET